MSNPKLLCIDEPSTGLAPIIKEEVFNKINEIRKMGITVAARGAGGQCGVCHGRSQLCSFFG